MYSEICQNPNPLSNQPTNFTINTQTNTNTNNINITYFFPKPRTTKQLIEVILMVHVDVLQFNYITKLYYNITHFQTDSDFS